MFGYTDIRHLHLEISSECNAACPQCPRNFHGYAKNFGYPEHSMTLAEAQHLFKPEFIGRLDEILINGNFGDIVMCPEAVDIVRWFRGHNARAKISISTNGGARNREFWQDLAAERCEVHFCLDGLEDTHSIYRRNTVYSTVIGNAKTFIAAGGRAVWKFIVFDHNQHQIADARALSKQMGFQGFAEIRGPRTQGPVFDNEKRLVFHLGKVNGPTEFDAVMSSATGLNMGLHNLEPPKNQGIKCWAKQKLSVYVTSTGEVYPCCWTGFYPRTYGQDLYAWRSANAQIAELIRDNNAMAHGLEKSIEWFSNFEPGWHKTTYEQGLPHICDRHCG